MTGARRSAALMAASNIAGAPLSGEGVPAPGWFRTVNLDAKQKTEDLLEFERPLHRRIEENHRTAGRRPAAADGTAASYLRIFALTVGSFNVTQI